MISGRSISGQSISGNAPSAIPTPPSGGAAQQVKFTLGTKEPTAVTVTPTVGGKWSW